MSHMRTHRDSMVTHPPFSQRLEALVSTWVRTHPPLWCIRTVAQTTLNLKYGVVILRLGYELKYADDLSYRSLKAMDGRNGISSDAVNTTVVIFFVVISVAGLFMSKIGNVTIINVHQGLSKQVMEEAYSSFTTIPTFSKWPQRSSSIVMLGKEKVVGSPKTNRRSSDHLTTEYLPSQPRSNPRGSIPTLFLCANQEGKEDALLNIEDVESLNHKEVHEFLEEVEEENIDQEAKDVDHQDVEDKDKESKGMTIVHSASSEATPPMLPFELNFKWVNPFDMNFLGPVHYGLLDTDGQLKDLLGMLDKKEMDSLELDESRFITCGESEFKAYSGKLHKLHNKKAKVGALNLRKHLGPCQFQEKLVYSQNNGWTDQVWDPGKSYKSQHFWGFITCLWILANLIYMIWNPIKNTKSKHWWRFIASVGVL
ncbi:hypothetical protein PIB30_056439 [Stylosanthes scabra]|uniref:Uncharacterized protein n=1 Tax=Stylosanthes scabra TaxID=79078 RepID=A0ABU6VMI0_9FABA|nr:hypothetical protein [Stylosanthes scabra]